MLSLNSKNVIIIPILLLLLDPCKKNFIFASSNVGNSTMLEKGVNDSWQTLSTEIQNLSSKMLMSKAWSAFDLFRLGDAHFYANIAWNKNNKNFAEADYLIGLIHYTNASYILAKHCFNRALSLTQDHHLRMEYLYALASVHLAEGKVNEYTSIIEIILVEGLEKDHVKMLENQRKQARQILFSQGLNRVIELYRWPTRQDLHAAESLAMLNYHIFVHNLQMNERQKNENQTADLEITLKNVQQNNTSQNSLIEKSIELLLYTLNGHISIVLDRLTYYYPDYKFLTLEKLFNDMQNYQEIRDYAKGGGLYKSLYLLSVTMHLYDLEDTQYKVLLNILRQISETGEWAKRAQAQFDKPYIETYYLENTQFILNSPKNPQTKTRFFN